MHKAKKNIFLIGPMGAGKSSIGRLLAKKLAMEFYDSDQIIEKQTGANIPWIFDIEGEQGFRKREMKVIEEYTQKQNIVLATGGGVVLNPNNRKNLINRGVIVYLQVTIDEQIERTGRSRNRPLILNQNPRDIFEKLNKEREPLYQELADVVINTQGETIYTIVDKIIASLEETL